MELHGVSISITDIVTYTYGPFLALSPGGGGPGAGGGTRYIKKVGMFVKNFEIDP